MPENSKETAPNRGAFQPGRSGNPGGRPRMTDERRVAILCARALTQEAIDTLVAIMTNPGAPASARVSAACAILDRGWGRAPQVVDVTKPEDKPFAVAHLPPEVATQIYLERVRGQIPK